MKIIALAFLLATATLAQAQQYPDPPKTVRLHNNATGEHLGTVTLSGNRAYLRNKDGEHYATMVRNADGTKTIYDPSGKVIEAESLKLPQLPE
jgi:hypothetical protein